MEFYFTGSLHAKFRKFGGSWRNITVNQTSCLGVLWMNPFKQSTCNIYVIFVICKIKEWNGIRIR